jgi:hypothetical protein
MAVHFVLGSVKIEGELAHIEVLNDIVAGFPDLARKRAEVPSGEKKCSMTWTQKLNDMDAKNKMLNDIVASFRNLVQK